jgi:aldose 1-epimerase
MPITLDAGDLRVSIDPDLGASIVDFSIKGPCDDRFPLMRRAPAGPITPGQAASFVMAPWTNRLRDARFAFDGQTHQLRPNFPDATAIHGTARDAPWRITDRTPVHARMVYDARADEQANFPFAFSCVQRFELAPDHLQIDLAVTNLDHRPMPAACGHHPFFPRTLFATDEQVRLHAPVTGHYPAAGCLPTGPAADDDACAALRQDAPLANPGLDDVFAGFGGRAVITWPASRVRLTMECSPELAHLVVFTPRAAGDKAAPPLSWFCVEPCTATNDAFNLAAQGWTNTAARTLAPGETLATTVTYRVDRM